MCIRDRACGGPRISHELAKELGYDAGFGMNTYADDVASFIAQELDLSLIHILKEKNVLGEGILFFLGNVMVETGMT